VELAAALRHERDPTIAHVTAIASFLDDDVADLGADAIVE
jgi:hypothetical protein